MAVAFGVAGGKAGRHQGLLAPGAVSYSDQLIPQSELERSYFWQAFLQRYGTTDALSAVIELPPHAPAMTFITFHRGPGDPRFSDAEARQTLLSDDEPKRGNS